MLLGHWFVKSADEEAAAFVARKRLGCTFGAAEKEAEQAMGIGLGMSCVAVAAVVAGSTEAESEVVSGTGDKQLE